MRIHLILDVQRDDTPGRATFDQVTEALEPEVETLGLEVGNAVYEIRVVGVGQTAHKAAESMKLRSFR